MEKMINCVFDGACEPRNPGGCMGIGAAIFEERTLLLSHSEFIPANFSNTNNVAEYKALSWIIEKLIKENLINEKISIYGDSKLVINQMNLSWKIKQGNYTFIAKKIKERLIIFKNIQFIWIPREKNKYADDLSKKELLIHGVTITKRK